MGSLAVYVSQPTVRLSTTKERPHRFALHSSPAHSCAFCLLFCLSSLVEWLAAQNVIGLITPFDCKHQNPSGFDCLMLIRATVMLTPLGTPNLTKKSKTDWIAVVVVKSRYRSKLPLTSCHATFLMT